MQVCIHYVSLKKSNQTKKALDENRELLYFNLSIKLKFFVFFFKIYIDNKLEALFFLFNSVFKHYPIIISKSILKLMNYYYYYYDFFLAKNNFISKR